MLWRLEFILICIQIQLIFIKTQTIMDNCNKINYSLNNTLGMGIVKIDDNYETIWQFNLQHQLIEYKLYFPKMKKPFLLIFGRIKSIQRLYPIIFNNKLFQNNFFNIRNEQLISQGITVTIHYAPKLNDLYLLFQKFNYHSNYNLMLATKALYYSDVVHSYNETLNTKQFRPIRIWRSDISANLTNHYNYLYYLTLAIDKKSNRILVFNQLSLKLPPIGYLCLLKNNRIIKFIDNKEHLQTCSDNNINPISTIRFGFTYNYYIYLVSIQLQQVFVFDEMIFIIPNFTERFITKPLNSMFVCTEDNVDNLNQTIMRKRIKKPLYKSYSIIMDYTEQRFYSMLTTFIVLCFINVGFYCFCLRNNYHQRNAIDQSTKSQFKDIKSNWNIFKSSRKNPTKNDSFMKKVNQKLPKCNSKLRVKLKTLSPKIASKSKYKLKNNIPKNLVV